MYNFEDKICARCGKSFLPAVYHIYKDNKGIYCSWTCYNRKEERIRRSKIVCQFTTDGEFIKTYSSAREAAEAMDCSYHTITMACRENKEAVGFLWKYEG